ncbi:AAA domain-containing protein [Helicobacter cappadocius]|uniref:AAA domain-containing protein n=1 Tax=Helicobacter cappadocius TaxID=3063998 RepID=A0AA90PUW7_9HELI|nr:MULTISPECIES: AAA domain-containing protein [unclassified Helicobacter]MDO7253051.1 AAA domain-containing protein [Helicobacter sp. faydin-H75]MDP2538960.1 AAA domain-containing protein [Helicobacter sp. faydin-H76]
MIKKDVAMRDILIKSSQIYYQFLAQNDLGLENIKIVDFSISGNEVYFSLKSKLFNVESLILRIGKSDFFIGNDNVGAKYYDEKLNILCLEVDESICANLKKIKKQEISLLSDLKFLVKSVEDFFSQGSKISLPNQINELKPSISKEATLEQGFAIENIFSHPISYVWGPPGSGKTQVVLFESLLNFIYAGKKICVLAPTNNALEQVLKTLIKKFDKLGLNREKILRLGMPTNSFLTDYIEVCDPNILKKTTPSNLFNFDINTKDRLKESLLVGMTVDGFIRKYRALDIKFEHIFLDECAFTPLIKACALCVDNTPLTFLGDHKQLSPICEMPQKDIAIGDNFYANLWNLSALNLEEFISGDALDKSNPIFSKTQYQEVFFKNICVLKLTKTHRYGDNLAKILDEYIYKNGLRGTDEHTELFYIDSKSSTKDEKHTNISEARSILELSRLLRGTDYAILTPFVRQRKYMIEIGIPRDRVWTIHGSQGQEFDTVVFSPVGLHYHLTDSYNFKALHALNVAVSRIKKRLIIVCDYEFWKMQQGQFLKNILDISKPFDKVIRLSL